MKYTTLYETHKRMGAKFLDFSGWNMPLEYEGMLKEHYAVRNKAGLFDVSHMGVILTISKLINNENIWKNIPLGFSSQVVRIQLLTHKLQVQKVQVVKLWKLVIVLYILE